MDTTRLEKWLQANIRTLNKTRQAPTLEDKDGIYFVKNNEYSGLYVVSTRDEAKQVYKIFNTEDYDTSEEVTQKINQQISELGDFLTAEPNGVIPKLREYLDGQDELLDEKIDDLRERVDTQDGLLQNQIDGLSSMSSRGEFTTYSSMINSYTDISPALQIGQFVAVTEDPDTSLNGLYRYTGLGNFKFVSAIGDLSGYVKYTSDQDKTSAEKKQALKNIGAIGGIRVEGNIANPDSDGVVDLPTDKIDQLADDVEQLAYVKIKNEAVNGNFENGLIAPFSKTDGSGGTSTLAINSSTPISGNYDIRFTIITPSTGNRPLLNGLNRTANIGDKIYLHFYAKILSGTPNIGLINDGGSPNSIYAGGVINGRNARIIDVAGTSNSTGIIYFNSPSAWDMQMDNFMHINLTEAFGAGNEPTEEEMNLLLDILSVDYFEGEYVVPQAIIFKLQLALTREKAAHGYETAEPKTLKQVDDEVSQKASHGYLESEIPKTLKQVDDVVSQLEGEINGVNDFTKLVQGWLKIPNHQSSGIELSMIKGTVVKLFESLSVNLFNEDNATLNMYSASTNSWAPVNNASNSISGLVPVIPGEVYKKTVKDVDLMYSHTYFFDANGKFISRVEGRVITAPANAYWCRMNISNYSLPTFMFCREADYPDDYIPYKSIFDTPAEIDNLYLEIEGVKSIINRATLGRFAFTIEDKDGNIAFGIEKDGGVYAPGIELKNNSESGGTLNYTHLTNDLVGQGSIFPFEASNYGEPDSEYIIPMKGVNRISAKFRLTKPVNNILPNYQLGLYKDDYESVNVPFETINALPEIQRWTYLTETDTYVQRLNFISGFSFDTDMIFSDRQGREPLVGKPIFYVWLKGYDLETEVTQQELTDREEWLSNHQDYCLDISSDKIRIIRDGIGEDGNPYNGGATSTLLTVELKDSGEWKSLSSVYEEFKTGSEPLGIFSDWRHMSSREDASSIAQVGKTKLVGKFSQAMWRGGPRNLYYDSYPTMVYSSLPDRDFYLDVVLMDNKLSLFVDGIRIGQIQARETGQFHLGSLDGAVVYKNLNVFFGQLGDAEVVGDRIISNSTPSICGFMAHDFEDVYETQPTGDYGHSVTRMHDVISLMHEKGYNFVNVKDLLYHFRGNKKLPKRAAFIISDDVYFEVGYQNIKRIRNSYEHFGVPMIWALQLNHYYESPDKDSYATALKLARLNGHDMVSHSYDHSQSVSTMGSVLLMQDTLTNQDICEELGITREVFCYNSNGVFPDAWTVLQLAYVDLGIHHGSMKSGNFSQRYGLMRRNLADNIDFNIIKNEII